MKKDELKRIIGRNIRKYRLRYNTLDNKRLTQTQLAELIGAKRSLIGAIESDSSTICISVFNLYKISKVLNIRIDKFFEVEV